MEAATPASLAEDRPWISCDLCGSQAHYQLPEAETYGSGGVVVCGGCGFVYVPVRRSAAEIAASWEEIYKSGGYTSRWPMVEARLTYVAEWYGQLYGWNGKSVLEIGAGEGRFLELVRGRGAYPVGLEPSAAGCQLLRSKDIMAHHGTIERCGKVGSFDVVAILWTLENCQDCIGMLKAARENLAPGGHVLIATGSRILVPFKKRLSTYFSKNPPDCHAFRFSAETLGRALRKAGLHGGAVNDFSQCDWLVRTAEIAPPDLDDSYYGPDDPADILDFFKRWAREWP